MSDPGGRGSLIPSSPATPGGCVRREGPPARLQGGLKERASPKRPAELPSLAFPATGHLGKGEGAARADGEAVAKELTSLAKWRRVTARASVLAVLELIVARRRGPDERGGKDANTPVRSGRTSAAGSVGRAVGRTAERREPGRRAGCGRPSLEVLAGEGRKARMLLGGALARGLPQRPEPAFYMGRPRRRVLQ